LRLSNRLETIVEMAPKSNCIADIGTDHGFVPIRFVEEGRCEKAIASDVGAGPLERAKAHVLEAGLQDQIDIRLGSGLETLQPGECDTVVIAGMGGPLMESLLEASKEVCKKTKYFLLSPHTEPFRVRKYLTTHGFFIEKEEMVFEEGKYYVIILFSAGTSDPLTEEEALFGPILLKKRPQVFIQYLKNEERKLLTLLTKCPPDILAQKEKSLLQIQKLLSF